MTETEWFGDPPKLGLMLYHVAEVSNERKLRLFLYACCRRIELSLVDHRSRAALSGLERYIEGQLDHDDLASLQSLADEARETIERPLYVEGILRANAESSAACAILCAVSPDLAITQTASYTTSSLTSAAYCARESLAGTVYRNTKSSEQAIAADKAESVVQAALLCDIVGNPFRPVSFSHTWRTSTAIALASQMYESREFGAMPILADALQEAGCDNADMLDHCRGLGPHVRGCWVVDLVLGKE